MSAWGRMIELGHAAALGKLVVVIQAGPQRSAEANPHHHPFVLESATIRAPSLDAALDIISNV